MIEIILIGGGGHCVSCIDVIEMENRFKIAGIVDQNEKIGNKVLGYEIIGTDKDIPSLLKSYNYFHLTIGQIGKPDVRLKISSMFQGSSAIFPTLVSPLAYVSKHASIGAGTIVMHFAMINAGAHVGEHCIINSKSLIEHDAEVGDFCHVATGAIVNGGVKIGKESFLGSASVTKQSSIIPDNSFVKANILYK